MRSVTTTRVLLALLLVNAAALLFFRFFITVDGPTHLLHAHLLHTPDHVAQGITYNTDALHGWLGDRILGVLLLFFAPLQAHAVFAALVGCAVVLAVCAFLRAHGVRMGVAVLWLAPLALNLLLIMGLFHFLLSAAIAFGAVGWWKSRAHAPRMRWLGLLVGAALGWYAHRGGVFLLCLLFLPCFLFEVVSQRTANVHGVGTSPARWIVLAAGLCILGLWQLMRTLRGMALPDLGELPAPRADLLLKPLYVLDQVQEQWLVGGVGILLLLSTIAAMCGRYRLGRKGHWHDPLLLLFVALSLAAWLLDSPHGHQLLLAERCQWLALVMLVTWLTAMADAGRGWVTRVIGGAALCALPIQGIRLVQVERSLAHLEQPYALTMEAVGSLAPGSMVMPIVVGQERLLQHLPAFVAIAHQGIVLAPKEQLSYNDPQGKSGLPDWHQMAQDPTWLARYWRRGIPKEVDQVIFIGSGIADKVEKHPWPVLLGGRYQLSFENGYARVYSAAK